MIGLTPVSFILSDSSAQLPIWPVMSQNRFASQEFIQLRSDANLHGITFSGSIVGKQFGTTAGNQIHLAFIRNPYSGNAPLQYRFSQASDVMFQMVVPFSGRGGGGIVNQLRPTHSLAGTKWFHDKPLLIRQDRIYSFTSNEINTAPTDNTDIIGSVTLFVEYLTPGSN